MTLQPIWDNRLQLLTMATNLIVEKPKKGIELASAKINNISTGSPSGLQNNSPAYTPHSSINSLPLLPPHTTASHLVLPLMSSHLALKVLYRIAFKSLPPMRHEFCTDSENNRLKWMKLLGLLVMFP